MQTQNLTFTVLLMALITFSCATKTKETSSRFSVDVNPSIRSKIINQYTKGWSESATETAKNMITKYGDPFESTPSMLMWKGIPPVKKIIVYRDEIIHQFPLPHKDVIEHTVDFKIPLNKAAELVKFDGSVIFDRTRGELSARSNEEAMNFLILNLASDIIRGKRSSSNARKEYEKLSIEYLNGNKSSLTQGLQFNTQTNTADSDVPTKFKWPQIEEFPNPRLSPKEKKKLLKQAQEEEITE